MISAAAPGRAISLLGAAPGAIQITDIVALKEYYGVTFSVLAVTHPAPTTVRFYPGWSSPSGYLGDESISVDGSLQTGKKVLVPLAKISDASVYGVAYSALTMAETSAGDSYVVPQRIPNATDGYPPLVSINIANLRYGTDAGWSGNKYYVYVEVETNAIFSSVVNGYNRARSFYCSGTYTTEANVIPTAFSNVTPIYPSAWNGGDFIAMKIPLVGPGSPVNKATYTIWYSYYPAFSVTGTSISEYSEDLLTQSNLTDRIGY